MLCIENILIDSPNSLKEKYFDYVKGRDGYRAYNFEVYLNPTPNELKNFIWDECAGYITLEGDLYLMGTKSEEYGIAGLGAGLHVDMIKNLISKKAIANYSTKDSYTKNGYYTLDWIQKYGVAVFRHQEYIVNASSVTVDMADSKIAIENIFEKAKVKNPTLEFMMA